MQIGIVTGASRGMGAECVGYLVRQFYNLDEIWMIGRNHDALRKLAKRHYGMQFRLLTLDLCNQNGQALLKQELNRLKPEVKVFVNAAGIGYYGNVMDTQEENLMEMLDLNTKAMVRTTYQVLPYMARHSYLLQFASAAGFAPQPGFAVYAAGKSFVLSFTRALRRELEKNEKTKNIHVTAVCPGPVKTDFLTNAYSGQKLPLLKKLTAANPRKVVIQAFRDAYHNRSVSVYGGVMKVFRIVAKIMPTDWLLRFM